MGAYIPNPSLNQRYNISLIQYSSKFLKLHIPTKSNDRGYTKRSPLNILIFVIIYWRRLLKRNMGNGDDPGEKMSAW